MSTVSKKIMMGSGAVAEPYKIEQSLILDDAKDAYLKRTPSSAGNRRTFTLSCWIKRSTEAVSSTIFAQDLYFQFEAGSDERALKIGYYTGAGGHVIRLGTTAVFRDMSAWYHIVLAIDTTQGTASNRVKIYVNGVQQTSFQSGQNTFPSQNLELPVNNTTDVFYLGALNATAYSIGYLAETHFIDGTAKAASDFGETNEDTGQWIPKEYTGGSYGTNGFYQKYEKGTATDNPFLFEGDFTIEMFFKLTSMQAAGGYSYPVLLWLPPHTGVAASGSTGYKLQIDNGLAGYALFMYGTSPDEFFISAGRGAGAISLNTWYHTAIVREGMGSNNLSIYVNGSRISQVTYTGPVGSIGNTAYVGASGRNYGNFGGYINNLRIVKGTAVYSGSSFTVPTSNLSAISGTSLLALQGSGITDRLPASAPTLTAYDTGGGGHTPIIQSNISGAVGTYTGLFYKDGYNNGNGGGISFNVPSTIGKDSSGNNNDFTPASALSSDVVIDSPTDNFCTLNPLDNVLPALSEGNTNTGTAGANSWKMARSTFELTTGKWYWEMKWTGNTVNSTNGYQMGLKTPASTLTAAAEQAGSFAFQGTYTYLTAGSVNTVTISPGSATTGQNDIIMFAYDADAGKMWIGVNGTWTSSGNPATGSNFQWTSIPTTGVSPFAGIYGSNISIDCNFGQKTYAYTPPSGFKALSTANLPDPAIPLPSAHFNTVVYTGNATARTIDVGMQPSFTWIKRRDGGGYHYLADAVRGFNTATNGSAKVLSSNDTPVEFTSETQQLTSFVSNGFTLGTNSDDTFFVNNNTDTYVAWNWKANGSGSTNNDGNQASSVSANQAAGFSIATFTGTGSYATYGHGLGVIPEVTLTKSRSASGDWYWVTTVIDGSVDYLVLNTTAAAANGSATASTSSVFYSNYPNNQTAVAYNFASKPNYSSIGIFTGNGSNTGPFVNCGFRPAWLLIKLTSASGDHDWFIVDNKRDPDNFLDRILSPNLNAAEGQADPPLADFLSNGFKIRAASASINGDGAKILYMAFAESPFKYANAR